MEDEVQSGDKEIEFDVTDPIIINLGKQKKKRIKNLLKGRGKLWAEVEGVIEEVGLLVENELDGKTIVPLVVIYKETPKKRRGMLGL